MLNQNWLQTFDSLFKTAKSAKSFDATAVRLSTCSTSGQPSCRMVLLKSYDEKGFVIYTNFEGRKGKEILENPQAALYFYWPKIGKEIAIEGKVEMVSDEESDQYFQSRAFFSKIGAHASKQSRSMCCRLEFFIRIIYFSLKYFFRNKVDRPSYWRGFRIVPDKIEFKNY